MFNLAKRNFFIYIKDKGAVFFSLLGVFVIIGLYMMFLGNTMTHGLENIDGIDLIMDSWVMAGIIAVSSITTSMGAFGVMVTDKTEKQEKDLLSSPLSRWKIMGGYILGAAFTGVIMSCLTFLVAEIYLMLQGASLLSGMLIIKVIGIIIITVIASCSMLLFIMTFIKSNAAFSGVSIILGTLIGFLTGMYIPIGTLSEPMQWVVKCFPVSHASVLLRQVFVSDLLEDSFLTAPVEILREVKEELGIIFYFNGNLCSSYMHAGILVLSAVLFFLLTALIFKCRRHK